MFEQLRKFRTVVFHMTSTVKSISANAWIIEKSKTIKKKRIS